MYSIYDYSLKCSGNKKTLNRLSKLLCISKTKYLLNNIITINAYTFGLRRKDKKINYMIIIGGTDINFNAKKNQEKFKIVSKTLHDAKYIVVFNNYMYDKVIKDYKINDSKISIIPQSIPKKLRASKFNLREYLCIKNNKKIFINVGNLRSVKRPEYLFKFFKKSKKYVYVLIGNIIEGDYTFPANVYHIKGLRSKDIYSCMKNVDGLINTSKNEGMSLSILEAMKLKCPVYAFENLGNLSIVKHGFNGYIFNNLISFKFVIRQPIKKIIRNAYDYVYIKHSTRIETYRYLQLLD